MNAAVAWLSRQFVSSWNEWKVIVIARKGIKKSLWACERERMNERAKILHLMLWKSFTNLFSNMNMILISSQYSSSLLLHAFMLFFHPCRRVSIENSDYVIFFIWYDVKTYICWYLLLYVMSLCCKLQLVYWCIKNCWWEIINFVGCLILENYIGLFVMDKKLECLTKEKYFKKFKIIFNFSSVNLKKNKLSIL